MMQRLQSGWQLFRQSWAVLRSDKQLMLFPIFSTISLLLVLASFAVPTYFLVDWAALKQAADAGGESAKQELSQPAYYAVLFAFYFVNFFVITFFNAGLVRCAINKFNGQDASFGAGIRSSVALLPQITAWALVAATVGMVLKMIEERAGFIGKFVINLIGMAWAIATFFVVPVLVVERVGPIEAVKRSVGVLRKTWGESLAVNLGIGVVTVLIALLMILVPVGAGIGLAIAMESWIPAAVGGAISIVLLMALSLVTTTLKGIVLAATYQYASTGVVPGGFDSAVLQQAFKHKKAKK